MKNKFSKILLGGLLFLLVACGEAQKPSTEETETARAPEISKGTVKLALPEGAGDSAAGGEIFETCTACHGPSGAGNREMAAPALANMAPWSLKKQLVNFRSGLRGGHAEDDAGQQMAAMAESLDGDQAILDVVAYIDSLPPVKPAASLKGDIRNGARYYNMICGACHGPGGEGIEEMNAPALAGVDDWYLERQYYNFQAKIRGYHPADKSGRQMVMMSKSLPDDQTLKDILSYLQSVPQKGAH